MRKLIRAVCYFAVLMLVSWAAIAGGKRQQTQPQASVQVTIPDTPAGKRLAGWLEAFNSGDSEALRKFREEGFANPPRRTAEEELEFRERTGGFELRGIVISTSTHIAAQLKEKNSEQRAEIQIDVEPEQPHRITAFGLQAVQRPAAEPVARMTEAEALAAADKREQELCGTGQFSGVAMIARGSKALFTRACGDADREKKIANRVDTKINLGSMNKMFTATAVLQLVERGKIRVEDPVGIYLSDYPNREVAEKVTVHELLTHTGGTGDVFGPAFRENREKLKGPADYVALHGTRAPQFEPGSRYEYSNYGFEILGAVIEKVSGQSYYDYVRKHIFAPAGMKDTDSYFESEAVPNRAIGYTHMLPGGGLQPNTPALPPRGSPAGGGYSTASDLLKFAEALTGHKLLGPAATELLTTGKVGPAGQMYAYGFHDLRENGVRVIGHNGGGPGINASLGIYPESGYVVVVLANLDPPAAENLAQLIGARLPAR